MAYFIRGTGQAVTPLQHSMDIFKQYMLNMFFKNMIGKKGSGKPIIADDSLFKGRNSGDVGRYHFIPQFRGKGIRGQNASVLGNENSLEEFYMDLRIDQIAQAFRKKGKMTTKRMIWDFRAEAKAQLTEWFRMQTELDIIETLSGFNPDGATYSDGTAALTQDAVNGVGRCIRPDYSSDHFETVDVAPADTDATSLLSAMNSADKMNTTVLDVLQDYAKTANSKYAMKPIRCKNGEEYYMLVLHPKAAIDLRNDPRWEKRALASMTGKGSLEGDPIATGSIGVWEHIIVKEAEFIKTHSNAGGTLTIARNLLLGADAAVMAWGQHLDYSEERLDFNRIISCAADEIRGIKKITFDGVDLNMAQVPSAI